MSEYNILKIDPLLTPYKRDIDARMDGYKAFRAKVAGKSGSLSEAANGHLFFGFHQCQDFWVYREWAPNATEMALIGEFNMWDRSSHKLVKKEGYWELVVPGRIPHGSRVKVQVTAGAKTGDRIPLYCKRVVHDKDHAYDGMIWSPPQPFIWTDQGFAPEKRLFIYECHIGISSEKEWISSFAEFERDVLPRIQKLGYNAIQIMAIMEHPYYASFGYQVTNFFAVSSRFGAPEQFKSLVNKCHSAGIAVLMDIVHSHASKNTAEGLYLFDGTEHQFFISGDKGNHPAWGTKLFDYAKPEVACFLLSNLKYWLTEYHLDGFRFDGVTSMLYHDHGLGAAFDNYRKYFTPNTDLASINYLQLACELCKEIKPDIVLIAEDMSGMPGMCLPVADGGVGFDYRLGMGLPDYYIKLVKEIRDENWPMGHLWYELNQRRPREKVIAYCESHDQALVGDKTLMFWLADKEMYWYMNRFNQNPVIDRAMSLHKMIRLITCVCGGDGYLNFMGNEFGHPEWIDFPRAGNNDSYAYARRQWSLLDDNNLRYSFLNDFDIAMIALAKKAIEFPSQALEIHERDKIIAFYKGEHLFVFNFHPTRTRLFALPDSGKYEVVLHSNDSRFGGFLESKYLSGILSAKHVAVDRRCAVVLRKRRGKRDTL